MSGITDFLQNNVDLSGYFPAYEVLTQQIVVNTNVPNIFELELTLTRNKNGTTNYIVLSQPYIISTNYGLGTLSSILRHAVIYKKTATKFSATIYTSTPAPPLNLTADIWFVVIYPYSSIQPIITSLDYYDSAGDPIDFFPQYLTSSLTMPNGNVSLNIDLTLKSTSSTNYHCFGSLYDTVSQNSALSATGIQEIMYYTVGQTNTNTQIRIRNQDSIPNINVETLVLYPESISTNNYTSNYFVKINNISYSLSTIFPLCEIRQAGISNDSPVITTTFLLNKNFTNTTNYIVLASFVYNSAGTSGTYDPFEASSAADNLLISDKTSTTFTVVFQKSTGDNWNGGIRCLVIYL